MFWYDSGTKAPYVGAGQGGPQLILDAVGATNVFADLDGGWAEGNWEDVIAADPDVIVLADASWDEASAKLAHLENDPVLSQLRAVEESRFVTIPFSESTPGVRLVDGAVSVSEQLAKLELERVTRSNLAVVAALLLLSATMAVGPRNRCRRDSGRPGARRDRTARSASASSASAGSTTRSSGSSGCPGCSAPPRSAPVSPCPAPSCNR